jgi:hypothetical protein
MRSTVRIAAATAGVLLAAATLAGCTGGDAEPDASESPEPTETTAPAQVTDVTDAPGTGSDGAGGGFTGAAGDLEIATCEPGDGGWDVSGTVTSSAASVATYRIYISLLTGDNDTRALQQTNVEGVEPGASAEWSMTIPVEEDGLSCVPRVERYDEAPEGE